MAWRELDGVLPNGPAYVPPAPPAPPAPAVVAGPPGGSGGQNHVGGLGGGGRGSVREHESGREHREREAREAAGSGYHSLERFQYHSPISAYGDYATARPQPSPAPSRAIGASCSSLPLKRDASVDPLVSGEDWSATVAHLALVSGTSIDLELSPAPLDNAMRYNTWGGGRSGAGHRAAVQRELVWEPQQRRTTPV